MAADLGVRVSPLNALLVRVGADQSLVGGMWNGLVNARLGTFVYVPIPEAQPLYPGLEKPYSNLDPILSVFGRPLPAHLCQRHMHLDPDFDHLTYGDKGQRAKQLVKHLSPSDLMVFYAGLSDVNGEKRLTYAIIGLFVVQSLTLATTFSVDARDSNAHSRRILQPGADDLIVRAHPGVSGRLSRCIPIGEWRNRSYRVKEHLLAEWGGLSVTDGYLQRSARLPRFTNPPRFLKWLEQMNPVLIQRNN